jgi:hypothetical protein
MTDPTAARHGGNPFSEAAHASLTDKAKIRAAILTFIASRGDHGATSDEAESGARDCRTRPARQGSPS